MNAADSNVLVYACDRADARRREIALGVLEHIAEVLIWQVACEFIAAARKLTVQGFTASLAWSYLDDLLKMTPIVLPTRAVLETARRMHVEQQWAFWDAMIVSACLEAGVTRLDSEDLPGRAPPSGLEIVNPFA